MSFSKKARNALVPDTALCGRVLLIKHHQRGLMMTSLSHTDQMTSDHL